MGSVKDLEILEEPTSDSVGHAIFHFSDRYSVFDWGPMPEEIDGKGKALALMGAYTFERIEESGVSTHYMGMEEEGEIRALDELEAPSSRMHIGLVNVLEPEFREGSYDYSVIRESSVGNYLIPLEVIFRNRMPVGSSVRRRYSPQDLGLDVDEWPEETVALEEPILESSTKLEEQDRYIEDEEAEEMAGVPIEKIYKVARKANEIITGRAREVGMYHDDGKLEFLYVDGEIWVGDVAGTFDEDRFTYGEKQVSKEVLRQAYKKEQPDWVESVKEAKKRAKEEGIKQWKDLVDIEPRPLGCEDLVSEMYQAGANRYIGGDFFDVRELEAVMKELNERI